MRNRILLIVGVVTIMSIQACSRKSVPSRSEEYSSATLKANAEIKKADSVAVIRRAVKRKAVTAAPKVIVVNDQFAKKSVDGRYYYDLQGHRYWRSNKDGKYYIFNKSMTTDPAFKKPNN
jgi:cyanophycinase-like exopeptidase